MNAIFEAKLSDYDAEDIEDIIVKIENSFQIKFKDDVFLNIQTFGDFCDVVVNNLDFNSIDDCTKQQDFYKIRNAIAISQNIPAKEITLEQDLENIFPRKKRKEAVNKFKTEFGIDIKLLTYKTWLLAVIILGFTASLIAFYFNWKIALSGLLFFYFLDKVGDYFGKEFMIETIRNLTDKVSEENYQAVRRTENTINKKEVTPLITEVFAADLALEKSALTRDAKFSHAK